jgi:hypothetical protein
MMDTLMNITLREWGSCRRHASRIARMRDTRRTTRHLESRKGGGSGYTSAKRVWAVARSRSEQTPNSITNL